MAWVDPIPKVSTRAGQAGLDSFSLLMRTNDEAAAARKSAALPPDLTDQVLRAVRDQEKRRLKVGRTRASAFGQSGPGSLLTGFGPAPHGTLLGGFQ